MCAVAEPVVASGRPCDRMPSVFRAKTSMIHPQTLFPLHSQLLGESSLVSFPPLYSYARVQRVVSSDPRSEKDPELPLHKPGHLGAPRFRHFGARVRLSRRVTETKRPALSRVDSVWLTVIGRPMQKRSVSVLVGGRLPRARSPRDGMGKLARAREPPIAHDSRRANTVCRPSDRRGSGSDPKPQCAFKVSMFNVSCNSH